MDNSYEVVELTPNGKYNKNDSEELEFNEESVYQDNLANCEAYIRLKVGGYM